MKAYMMERTTVMLAARVFDFVDCVGEAGEQLAFVSSAARHATWRLAIGQLLVFDRRLAQLDADVTI